MSYITEYLNEVQDIAEQLDQSAIEKAVDILTNLKGRLFILGVGGSAANASHAVNDFRKITGIEAYAPTDNVAELTARTNDDGWETVFSDWLLTSKLGPWDVLLILSVGGGSSTTSQNLVKAMQLALSKSVQIISIVGRDGGHAMKVSDACILIPIVSQDRITPHQESFQAVIWHLLVNHPKLQKQNKNVKSIKNKAVFLDRDGTLNALINNRSPRSLEELHIYPDAFDALTRLKREGFKLIVITNQPDVSRGLLSRQIADGINKRLEDFLHVDRLYICIHTDAHDCPNRKPKTGMLEAAKIEFGIDLTKSYMIGDTWRDIEAGNAAGCKALWLHSLGSAPVLSGYEKAVKSLTEAADWILKDSNVRI
jgi:D-sedoheptulose 7-phosphate isomerase